MDGGAWQATVHGITESDIPECTHAHTNTHTHTIKIRENIDPASATELT